MAGFIWNPHRAAGRVAVERGGCDRAGVDNRTADGVNVDDGVADAIGDPQAGARDRGPVGGARGTDCVGDRAGPGVEAHNLVGAAEPDPDTAAGGDDPGREAAGGDGNPYVRGRVDPAY